MYWAAPLSALILQLPAQPGPSDVALMERLTALDAKVADVRDLTADFEQKKHTALLKEPMVSLGRVRVKGPVVRWDTAKPRPSVIRIDAQEMRVYYPEEGSLEIYSIDASLRRLTASPIPRLQPMREQFDITAMAAAEIEGSGETTSSLAIRLTPKEESIRKHVREVRVLIDGATGLTLRLETIDPDGDRTLIAFLKPRTNTGLEDRDLELQVPPNTKVSRPLDGLRPGAGGEGGK
jgi:outer membrane lipoprotein-sorting protein